MKPLKCGPATRLVLTSGVLAGAWLTLSASMAGSPALTPAGIDPSLTTPPPYHVAQVTLSPMVAPPPADAEPDAEPADRPVTFSSEQADRGEERYEIACEECHGDDLGGGLNGGAPLRGTSFEQRFADGAPAAALFLYMSNVMPPDAPGRYSDSTYIDLMAYILQENGFQPGAALPSDVEALNRLIMEK